MEILIARSDRERSEAYERLRGATVLGCDTETSSLSPQAGRLYSVQFSDGNLGVLVPLSEGVELGPLTELLSSREITKIFHNARFDLGFLAANRIGVENVFCTFLAEKVLTKGANQSCSLAETLYRHFGIDLDKSQRKSFTKKWDGVWRDELVHYALSDVVHLPNLMRKQTEWLERLGLLGDYENKLREQS